MMAAHIRQLVRGLPLAALLCLTLASALLTAMAGYRTAIAEREMAETLAQARPIERSLLITGSRYTFHESLFEQLAAALGPALGERLIIRQVALAADPQQAVVGLEIYSFNDLAGRLRIVAGRLPDAVRLREAQDIWRPPPIEAVIGRQAAEGSGYGLGDRLTASKGYHRLDIVGIVEPIEPGSDLWGEDLGAFEIEPGLADQALPLIIAPTSMQSNYPEQPIFFHQVAWRITIRPQQIRAGEAGDLRAGLINFQTQSATRGASVHTSLIQILADYVSRLARVQMTLLLLTIQTLLFVFYTLTALASSLVDRSQAEMITQAGRGASAWQIARRLAVENLLLALPAGLILGPGLAWLGLRLWSAAGGEPLPGPLPGEAWWLSGLAAAFGWLALTWPAHRAARLLVRGQLPRRPGRPQLLAIHRHYLDLYLLAFAGLLYWQLNRSGSFLAQAVTGRQVAGLPLADPLLLVGPTLLLVALALVFSRALPYLLRLLARACRSLRGPVLPLALAEMARDPLRPGRLVLLVSLTAGLVLFVRIFRDSLAHAQPALQADALARGTQGALQLNALALVSLSLAAFVLLQLYDAGQRQTWSLLWTMGFSPGQQRGLLLIQGLVVLILGLLAGTIVGLGLAYLTIPYLAESLLASPAAPFSGLPIVCDGPALARLYLLLLALYGAALALLALVAGRRPATSALL